MRGMKGKLMKKLKSAKPIGYLNPNQILQVGTFDGFVDNFNLKSTFVDKFPFKSNSKSQSSPQRNSKPTSKPEKIDVEELMRDIEVEEGEKDQEINSGNNIDDKENIRVLVYEDSFCTVNETDKPSSCCTEMKKDHLSEFDVLSFRRPDMGSDTLFDPKLLAAFENAVSRHIRTCEDAAQVKTCDKKPKYPFFQPEEDQPDLLSESDHQPDPLSGFDEKCPPGGTDSVVFYTTSLRGIRKTFEDCQSIRFLLESFGVVFYERDVSVHSEFRDELWRIMGKKSLPPRLFIRGRYIGGAEKVLTLNEQGKLRGLFIDIPIDFSEGPCRVCCGLRFMLCYNCNGSRKVFEDGDNGGSNGGGWSKCSQCNENGLVVCPLC